MSTSTPGYNWQAGFYMMYDFNEASIVYIGVHMLLALKPFSQDQKATKEG